MSRHLHWLAVPLLIAGLGSAACSDDSTNADDSSADTTEDSVLTPESLEGRTYASTSVEGRDLAEDTTVTLTFADGRLGVQAGCNSMSAAYEIDGDQLRWSSEPMSTMMGCPDALAAQDQWLTTMFTQGATVSGDTAALSVSDGEATIDLEEQ